MITEIPLAQAATQIATLLLFVLIPATGLFRIDLVAGTFVILGRQIWWSDFGLMLGFGIVPVSAAIMTYSTIGTVWCGWACPQNTLSEWANNLTHKLLGKRANVNVESMNSQVAATKNKAINWVLLALSFLAVSLPLGLIPFFYFFTPDEIWSFITFRSDSSLSQFMHRLYFVSVVAFFLDISGIRYFWCNYACMYRFGQRFFKTKDALHVAMMRAVRPIVPSAIIARPRASSESHRRISNPPTPASIAGSAWTPATVARQGRHLGLLRFRLAEISRSPSRTARAAGGSTK